MNNFQFQLPGPRSRWNFLTATATDALFNTSKFGPCLTVPPINSRNITSNAASVQLSGQAQAKEGMLQDALGVHVEGLAASPGSWLTVSE